MKRIHHITTLALMAWVILAAPEEAAAYVGPGAGLTAIGAALAFIGVIILLIFGFIWYPVKRWLRGRAKRVDGSGDASNR